MQMRFRPVVPLKELGPAVEEEGAAVVVERLQLPTPEQCRRGLALANQRTSCLAEEAQGP